MFLRFCVESGFLPQPAFPAVVTRFIEEAYGRSDARSVSTVVRALHEKNKP
jgi:hypothetical protein